MKGQNCFSTGSVIGSDKWKLESACYCVNCVHSRDAAQTNHDASKQRQYLAVKFEIDLPLRQEQVQEATELLEGVLGILKSAQRPSAPPAADAVDPQVGSTGNPAPRD